MAGYRYVWRLERDGKGAFRANGRRSLVDDADRVGYHRDCDFRRPPEPDDEDGQLAKVWRRRNKLPSDLYFGFRSLAQYRKWFYTSLFRENLDTVGGVLVRYRVPKKLVFDGYWQVAFLMDEEGVEVVEKRSATAEPGSVPTPTRVLPFSASPRREQTAGSGRGTIAA